MLVSLSRWAFGLWIGREVSDPSKDRHGWSPGHKDEDEEVFAKLTPVETAPTGNSVRVWYNYGSSRRAAAIEYPRRGD